MEWEDEKEVERLGALEAEEGRWDGVVGQGSVELPGSVARGIVEMFETAPCTEGGAGFE